MSGGFIKARLSSPIYHHYTNDVQESKYPWSIGHLPLCEWATKTGKVIRQAKKLSPTGSLYLEHQEFICPEAVIDVSKCTSLRYEVN